MSRQANSQRRRRDDLPDHADVPPSARSTIGSPEAAEPRHLGRQIVGAKVEMGADAAIGLPESLEEKLQR